MPGEFLERHLPVAQREGDQLIRAGRLGAVEQRAA